MATLLDQAVTLPHLHRAWLHVAQSSHMPGSDGVDTEEFAESLEAALSDLAEEVVQGRYQPLPLRAFVTHRPGHRPRLLAVPAVRDRVLQVAVLKVLTPIAEARFSDASFAYRPGRGVDQALERLRGWRAEGYAWSFEADIQSCFERIDHTLLRQELAKWFPDPPLLELLNRCIDVVLRDDGGELLPADGIPQGAPLSPLFCNIYLTALDGDLQRTGQPYLRYADDFILLARRPEEAETAREAAEAALAHLKLRLNPDKSAVKSFAEGLRFLGMWLSDAGDRRLAPATPAGGAHPASAPAGDAQRAPLIAVNASSAAAPAHDEEPPLRALYLPEPGWYLRRESERLVVRHNQQVLLDVPAWQLDQVVALGHGVVSAQALALCLEKGIPLFLVNGGGRLTGVVDSQSAAATALRRAQYRRADDPGFVLAFAGAVVSGKLRNMALVLRRYARNHDAPGFRAAAAAILDTEGRARRADDLDSLRGHEGLATRRYFEAWREIVPEHWGFNRRERHPPPDPVNAMLSFGYTLLYNNVYTFLRRQGLDPFLGLFHVPENGHAALASDLMEEFRPLVVDSLVLHLLLDGLVQPDDFQLPGQPGLACRFAPAAKLRFLRAFEQKVGSVADEADGTAPPLRRLMQRQTRRVADCLLGRADAYVPALQR